MDVLSFRTEIRRLIELRQEGEYWDFKKEWYQNKSDLLHDIICMATVLFARVKSSMNTGLMCCLITGMSGKKVLKSVDNANKAAASIIDSIQIF